MLRLLRFTLILVVISFYSIALARQIGFRSPDPVAEWFTNPDGSRCPMPCLFGIQPGITTYEDAIKLVTVHPVTRAMARDNLSNHDTSFEIGNSQFCLFFSSDSKDKIEQIDVLSPNCYFEDSGNQSSQRITPAQMTAIVGNPENIIFGLYNSEPDYYFYLNGQLTLNVMPVDASCTFSPYANYYLLEITEYDTRGKGTIGWKGFANRRLYDPSLC